MVSKTMNLSSISSAVAIIYWSWKQHEHKSMLYMYVLCGGNQKPPARIPPLLPEAQKGWCWALASTLKSQHNEMWNFFDLWSFQVTLFSFICPREVACRKQAITKCIWLKGIEPSFVFLLPGKGKRHRFPKLFMWEVFTFLQENMDPLCLLPFVVFKNKFELYSPASCKDFPFWRWVPIDYRQC